MVKVEKVELDVIVYGRGGCTEAFTPLGFEFLRNTRDNLTCTVIEALEQSGLRYEVVNVWH